MEEWRRQVDADIAVLKSNVSAIREWEIESRRFHATVNNFMSTFNATQEAIREEQGRRHRSNAAKLNVIVAFATIGLVFVTLLGIWVSYAVSKHQSLNDFIPQLSSKNPPVVAEYRAQE